ncbi:hypothetical protein B0H17DRAFT_1110154 [Mycena rosella]|uniref:Uncharacterized protein n=1 Tax=Mycena rosella TaxID=1033263 RepID=A0AAD7BQK8_MYCRO|nr:hypothetical protein B0H17DRAFT_1110154 [Mycena rosella]
MTEVKGLQDLVEDVLILILAHCDILSVLASNGDRRPDQNLNDLSTEQLVDQVKRALHGPKTWSPPSRGSRDLLQKGVDWGKSLPWEPGLWFCMSEPKLLPGGNYILQHWGTLECWNVFEDKLVWKHACSMDNATVPMFAAELTDDDKLVILTCSTPGILRVQITTLNVLTGFASLVLVGRSSDYPQDNPYRGCAVRGDIAAVELGGQVTLINWRTSSCVVILTRNLNSQHTSQIALAENCLVLTLIDPRGRFACSPLPSPVVREPSSHITVKDLPITFADTISLNGRTFTRGEPFLAVHESPVDPGRLESGEMGVLSSYEFIARESTVSWHRRSSVPLARWGCPFRDMC